jgi:hypothetical protein
MFLGLENLMFIHSGIAMQDIYEVIFILFAFWLYLKGPRWWWASAISIAAASLCKFAGVLAAVPIGLHWFIIGYKPNMGMPAETIMPVAAPVEMAPEAAPAPLTLELSSAAADAPVPVAMPLTTVGETAIPQVQPAPEKRTFWQVYSRPIVFVASFLIAPIAFFLLYGGSDMIVWGKYIPLVVWGHWDQGVVGDIKTALSLTDSIKFSYSGAFPARPWEWILSPTGSFYFYGWIFHPENYTNILLPYWYTPSYTGIISPSIWLAGLFVIPYAAVKCFIRKNNPEKNAAIFMVCWIIGTWLVWIPLFLVSDRITYIFYYLPTIGAIAIGTALIVNGYVKRIEKRISGFRKRFIQLAIASFLLFHLLAFCVLSPLHLWASIAVCTLLLWFVMEYLGFGRRFTAEYFISAGIAALLIRFALYWPLRAWLVTGNAPWGYPEVSMLWVVGALIGFVITWVLFALIHSFVNRIVRDNAIPPEQVINLPPPETAAT